MSPLFSSRFCPICFEDLQYQAQLEKALLCGTDLRETILISANLRGADLTEANLQGAIIVGAKFDKTTTLPNGRGWEQDVDMTTFGCVIKFENSLLAEKIEPVDDGFFPPTQADEFLEDERRIIREYRASRPLPSMPKKVQNKNKRLSYSDKRIK